jgi:hypothetical protein
MVAHQGHGLFFKTEFKKIINHGVVGVLVLCDKKMLLCTYVD